MLPEAGHLAWAEQPELIADMIIDLVHVLTDIEPKVKLARCKPYFFEN